MICNRKAWDVIFNDPNLTEASLRQRAISGKVCKNGLRSVCWRIYLKAIPTLDLSKWPDILLKSRQKYSELHRTLIDIPQEQIAASKKGSIVPTDATNDNPLGLNDDNPWQQHFADAEVRKIIRQDVERTFPDVEFFRDDAVQNQMTDVLFIYCKLNADVSYRQGMHELLAPIFLVLNTEGVDIGDGSLVGPADSSTKLMAQVLDKKYLEHDSYALFERLMSGAKKWYEFNDEVSTRLTPAKKKELDLIDPMGLGGTGKTAPAAQLTPIVKSCRRIQHQLLKSTDPALYQHLETLGIEPQLYGIRWIRLLFGREFSIENVLELWDAIFAEDPSLNIVEYICLVLLLRIRDKMVDGEYAECLTLLMRYPPIKEPVTCVEQAKYLRQNLTEEACLQILRQNDVKAGKPPRESIGPERPVDPRQRRANHASGLPSDGISKLTKDMMQNPQIREINRALVGVMGAVQKNMNTFGENVLGKSGPDMNNAARPVVPTRSNFPDAVDRLTDAPQYNPYQTSNQSTPQPPKATPAKAKPPMAHRVNKPLPSNTQYNDLVDNLHEVNSEMGQLLAKCVNVLERELFPDVVDEEKASEGEPQEGPKQPMKEEASVIMALVGIKHVRDVLLGKQRELDLSVANQIAQMNINQSSDPEVEEAPKPSNTADATASQEVVVKEMDSEPIKHDTEPKPSPVVESPVTTQPPASARPPSFKALNSTYVSPNPLPPKPNVSYNIEDLLSDTLNDGSSTTRVNNKDKFSWMMESSPGGGKKLGSSSSSLFSSSPGSSAASRSGAKRSGPRSPATSAVSVDPLDARHADRRKFYDE
ncbi:hypothetical protein INT44_008020 [Umbelopsis vinacea]|uniref:Rab-GAP TBC domain-containing protein n=1 Tax=Umbelopsis vinacea TaxID=44442 RepID=A0A8H7PNJ4_9FUNG|nr:hypothetical protein INT44_008020 [Umbelopsis vinacea]